jgi:RNA polymerase sigma factor (sigma-70 family)
MNPFDETYNTVEAANIIREACGGSLEATDQLVKMHQQFVYNIALKFVGDREHARDLTQDVFLKMLTKLEQFQFKSNFRTWLYQIAMNQFIDEKRKDSKVRVRSFDELGEVIDQLYDQETMTIEEQQKYCDEILFIRNKCLASVLLCLDRQQRMVYILGAIFNLKSLTAAKLLNISAENFRKQLSRAKQNLFQFMHDKCGLMNPDNPCRCFKKTKGFIKDGIIDPTTNRFSQQAVDIISSIAPKKTKDLDSLINGKYVQLFMSMPYEKLDNENPLVNSLLVDPQIRNLFLLN